MTRLAPVSSSSCIPVVGGDTVRIFSVYNQHTSNTSLLGATYNDKRKVAQFVAMYPL